jgi:hypothetical protein
MCYNEQKEKPMTDQEYDDLDNKYVDSFNASKDAELTFAHTIQTLAGTEFPDNLRAKIAIEYNPEFGQTVKMGVAEKRAESVDWQKHAANIHVNSKTDGSIAKFETQNSPRNVETSLAQLTLLEAVKKNEDVFKEQLGKCNQKAIAHVIIAKEYKAETEARKTPKTPSVSINKPSQ